MSKKKKRNKNDRVSTKVVVRPMRRNTADIESWRTALKAADRGNRTRLYELYEDLLLDNVLSDAIDKRIKAITNAEIVFTVNDKPVPEMDTLIDSPEFETLLEELMNAKFWGKTCAELDPSEEGLKVFNIPRAHIRPQDGIIVFDVNDTKGHPYREDPFIIEAGKDKDLGIILKAAPFSIYKRGNFGDWAQYAEIFGMPFRVGKYNQYDEATRDELYKALDESGSAGIAVIPKEGDIDFKQNMSSGNGTLYERLKNACNEEILIGILGQTMTTLNGSSRSQGEVHMEVQKDKHKADRRFIRRILNQQLVPFLEQRGWPVKGGTFSFPEKGETLSLKDRIGIDEKVCKLVKVPESYFYETYGIPMPKKNEPVANQVTTTPKEPEPSKKEKEKLALEQERNFFTRLRDFFGEAPAAGAINLSGKRPNMNPQDAALLRRIARGESPYFDHRLFEQYSEQLVENLAAGFKGDKAQLSVGTTYGQVPGAMKTAYETNLFHFAAAQNLTQVQELNAVFRASKSFEEFEQKAATITGKFNRVWARTEYNTAYHVAESAAAYHRLKAKVELFPYWQYRTVADGNVRKEHAKLHEIILAANDELWDKIYPPNGWNCRCYVKPLTKDKAPKDKKAEQKKVTDYMETGQFKKDAAQGWGVNRGKTGEVFSANQMYIRKFPGKAAKYLNKLGPADFNLNSIAKTQKRATKEMPAYQGTAQEWFDKHAREGSARLKEYQGREVILNPDNFKTHTTKSRAYRVKYLDALEQALNTPDEIWINDYINEGVFDNYTFIKYYKDEILVVCCRVEKGMVNELKTWFPLTMKKKIITKYRRGLLVHKK